MTDMTGFTMTARDVFADADEDLDGGVYKLEFYTYLKDAIDAGNADMVSENRAKAQTKADNMAPHAGASRGFLTPLAACPDPLRGSLYKRPLGNCCLNSAWTPHTRSLWSPGRQSLRKRRE